LFILEVLWMTFSEIKQMREKKIKYFKIYWNFLDLTIIFVREKFRDNFI
jgi:hypothetical protein